MDAGAADRDFMHRKRLRGADELDGDLGNVRGSGDRDEGAASDADGNFRREQQRHGEREHHRATGADNPDDVAARGNQR